MGTLPYPLASDWHKQTVKSYGVFNDKGEVAIRSVFVVNKEGVITYLNTSFKADEKKDYDSVFAELEKLNGSSSSIWMSNEENVTTTELLN